MRLMAFFLLWSCILALDAAPVAALPREALGNGCPQPRANDAMPSSEKRLPRSQILDPAAFKQALSRLEDVPGASLRGRRAVHRHLDRKTYIVRQHGE